jgi:hypothetical protein
MSELSITVQPTQRPALTEGARQERLVYGPVRAPVNKQREKTDAERRPQAAVVYRALLAAGAGGLSWRELWALSEAVGPVVIWMRAHGVEVEARYDPVVGETRFYL